MIHTIAEFAVGLVEVMTGEPDPYPNRFPELLVDPTIGRVSVPLVSVR
jgi:hypothetical protein